MKLLRWTLAVLCPETDGLQEKHRIFFKPDSLTLEEQVEDIIHYVYENIVPLWGTHYNRITQMIAKTASFILHVEGFTQEEIYHILQKERYKK